MADDDISPTLPIGQKHTKALKKSYDYVCNIWKKGIMVRPDEKSETSLLANSPSKPVSDFQHALFGKLNDMAETQRVTKRLFLR
eukprot:15303735-Ditylum_brightwellii.AAC.2